MNKPLRLKEIEKDTWSYEGTPVDCVIAALLGGIPSLCITKENREKDLSKAPDLVLSGINAGANLGTDIIYSGTAGAARQGSFFGIPSVALSLVDNAEDSSIYHWEIIIEYITENLGKFVSYWKEDTFININFPNNGKKPVNIVNAFPSKRHYNDIVVPFTAPGGRVYCHIDAGKVSGAPEEGSDWSEVLNGNAALSVILSQPCRG